MKKQETDQEKTKIIHRLSRIVGQLNGIKRMVEEDKDWQDILIQFSAVSSSIKSAQYCIAERELKNSVIPVAKKGNDQALLDAFEVIKKIK